MKRSLLLIIVAVFVFTGCGHLPWQNSGSSTDSGTDPLVAEIEPLEGTEDPPLLEPGLLLSSEHRFSDIPLPVGAVPDIERTYVFESKTLQIGRMVYNSKATVNELAQFYIKECPLAGWTRVSILESNGVEIMFNKPGKRLTVVAREESKFRGRLLVLSLTPEDGSDI